MPTLQVHTDSMIKKQGRKMLVGFHMTMYQYIPGDRTVNFHHHDNLKFNKLHANSNSEFCKYNWSYFAPHAGHYDHVCLKQTIMVNRNK
jgi:hypothetical protein